MSRATFRVADQARLEVALDPTATTNLITNPIPELGTWLWQTLDSLDSLTVIDATTPRFRYTSGRSGSSVYGAQHATFKVTPGQYVGASALLNDRSRSGIYGRVRLVFFRADGTALSQFLSPTYAGGGAVTRHVSTQVPANAASVSVGVVLAGDSPGPVAGDWVEFTAVAARTGSTLASVQTVGYTAPVQWRNIIGQVGDITAVHDGITVGTLTATLHSADLDPAVSTALRGGRTVRLMTTTDNLDEDPKWFPTWRGTTRTARAAYDPRQTSADRQVKITLTATNVITQAANVKRDRGVATTSELAYLFEGSSIPWAVDGSGTQPAGSPVYVTTSDPKKTLLDQVAITRDTQRAYAWVDRRGVLNVSAAVSRPTALAATLTEADYTALDYDYDTTRCINTVTIKLLTDDGTGKTGEVVYGPYVDQASVDTWGAYATEVAVQGLDPIQMAVYAANVLTANATPARKVNSLRVPIRTRADIARLARLDTYDLVRVTGANGLDQTLRISKITHRITAGVLADLWAVDLEFATDSANPQPIQVPAPPGASRSAT